MARPRPEPPNRRAVEPSACWKRWNRVALRRLRACRCRCPRPRSAGACRLRDRRGRAVSRTSTWPSAVNLTALPMRLNSTWRSRTGSARIIAGRPSGPIRCAAPGPWPRPAGRSRPADALEHLGGSIGSGASSSRPASTLEKSDHVVEQLGQQPPQPCASPSSRRPSLGQGLVRQQVEHAQHPVHRRADLMAHVGQELGLRLGGGLGGPLAPRSAPAPGACVHLCR